MAEKIKYIKVDLNLPSQLGHDLSLRELNVLCYIKGLTKQKGYCYATNKSIMEELNIPHRSLCRILDRLEELGLIQRVTQFAGHYGRTRKIYVSPSVRVAQ
jgi:DNA-binding MarR family transcriptional regulator